MKYKDAGQKLDAAYPMATSDKIYPRVHVDLKKFGRDPEMDEKIDIRGRVCGVSKHDDGGSVEIEVTDIGVPDKKEKLDDPKNEADRDLAKMMRR